MLPKLREGLVLILIIGLPFHAFLVTVGTRLLVGPGHAPLSWLAGWKEVVLGIILLLAVGEMFFRWIDQADSGKRTAENTLLFDSVDTLILGLIFLSLLTAHRPPPTAFVLGFKYTLFPLLLFLVLRRVPWSEHFFLLASSFLLPVGAVVAGYGILTLFLPEFFFTWLGYSDLHSIYLPDGPLAAFQYIEGTGIRRIQSAFSGPNQLGMWLLVPWSVAMVSFRGWFGFPSPLGGGYGREGRGIFYLVFSLLLTAVFLTFSRSAWIGAAVIATAAFLVPRFSFRVSRSACCRGSCWVVGLLGLVAIGITAFPTIFLRGASSSEHWTRPLEAIRIIAAHPLGLGLGSAGPASNRISDPCVFLAAGSDASWAKDRPNLCVFVGDRQAQPAGRVCRCPVLPENWYLQVGVELGVIGLVLNLFLVAFIIRWLVLRCSALPSDAFFLLPFVGISIAALFLHAWEDSAVAYTVWVLLAAGLSSVNHRRPSVPILPL